MNHKEKLAALKERVKQADNATKAIAKADTAIEQKQAEKLAVNEIKNAVKVEVIVVY